MKILQCYADKGAENPALSKFGNILRISWDIEPNQWSTAIQADCGYLPIKDDVTFDVGWFHPPCGGVSPMSDTKDNSRDEWPDLIPQAREIAKKHCDHWVIENKPRESLDSEVVLDGHMFELGIDYERGFETSFPVEQPPKQNRLADTSSFFYTEWSKGEWAAVKGSSMEFNKQHLAKNTIPAAYIDYIMKHYYRAVDDEKRPDYSDYDKQMDTRRNKEKNEQLTKFA